jgi:hypothetical protein
LRSVNKEAHRLVLRQLLQGRWRLAARKPEWGHRVLAFRAQVQRHPAGRQHLQAGCGAEEGPDGRSAVNQVLEVVQDQEHLPCQHDVLQATRHGLLSFLAEAQGRRDGGWHERRVGQGRQRDEEDAVGEVLEHLGGGLEREPGLPRATRTDEGQQLSVVTPQQVDDVRHLLLSTEEGSRLAGEVLRSGVHGSEGRKVSRQVGMHQLEDVLGLQQIAQSVLAEVAQFGPRRQRAAGQLLDRLRKENLSTMPC